MIPEDRNETKLTSTLTGRRIDFKIDMESTEFIMGLFTDMYEKPEFAVVREYSVNARDSHIDAHKAGDPRHQPKPLPIEVTTPTPLNSMFMITDHGVGLGIEEIEEIFTLYGASTKRDSNDVTGMLGMGSKSALAYTEQFSLIAVKDGHKVEASVTRNEKGIPELVIARESTTDDGNGVTILIPCERHNGLLNSCNELFKYWPEGTVLLNGKEPEHVEGLEIGDKFMVVDYNDARYTVPDRHRFVMGGVPYPVELNVKLPIGKRLIVDVPIGELHFNPAREKIIDTPMNQRYIEKVEQEFKNAAEKYVMDNLKKVKKKTTLLEKLAELNDVFPIDKVEDLKYKGKPLPAPFEMPFDTGRKDGDDEPVMGRTAFKLVEYDGYKKNAHDKVFSLIAFDWPKYVWVQGFGVSKFTSVHRDKLNAWIDSIDGRERRETQFCLIPIDVPDRMREWIDPANIVDWKDITKVSRSSSSTGPVNTYDMFNQGDWEQDAVALSDLKTEKNVFYFPEPKVTVRGGGYYRDSYTDYSQINATASALLTVYPNATIVKMKTIRINKFLRNVPKAKLGFDVAANAYKKWLRSLNESDKMGLYGVVSGELDLIVGLNEKVVRDPELKKALKSYNFMQSYKDDDKIAKKKLWSRAGYSQSIDLLDEDIVEKRYPLISSRGYYIPTSAKEDIALYINAKYNKIKKSTTNAKDKS